MRWKADARAALGAAALTLWLAAAPALAQIEMAPEDPALPLPEPPPPPPPDSAFMTDRQLSEAFTGADYRGCYPDGSEWAERTAADGTLYDLLQDGARVGSWWVQDRMICYDYPEMDSTACWRVIRRESEFYFFVPGTGLVGGTTDCTDPIA